MTRRPRSAARPLKKSASGSVTERLHFYAAPYSPADRTGDRGGVADEGEDIEIIELPVDDTLAMIGDGRIADGKTIMLLQWAVLSGPLSASGTSASGTSAARTGRPAPGPF